MRQIIYYLGIGCFMAMICYNVATSFTNPFYGMSEAALAQASSGNGYDLNCSGACSANCVNWYISYDVDCQGFFSGYHVRYTDGSGNIISEYTDDDNPWLIGDDPGILGCDTQECV